MAWLQSVAPVTVDIDYPCTLWGEVSDPELGAMGGFESEQEESISNSYDLAHCWNPKLVETLPK